MIVATFDALLNWVNDTTVIGKGVNNFIADQTITPVVPGHAAPPLITFFGSPISDSRVAEWKEPPNYPALYLTMDGPAQVDPEVATHNRDARSIIMAFRYLVKKGEAHLRFRDMLYTMEALEHSLKLFLADDYDGRVLGRTLLGCHIREAESTQWGPWYEDVGEARAIGALTIELYVRNNAP